VAPRDEIRRLSGVAQAVREIHRGRKKTAKPSGWKRFEPLMTFVRIGDASMSRLQKGGLMRENGCLVCGCTSMQPLALGRVLSGATTRGDALYPFCLQQCTECAHVQKALNADWYAGMCDLYERDYQFVGRHINCVDGKVVNRDNLAAERLDDLLGLGENGALLDVGCGEGTFIEAFRDHKPSWSVAGFDVGGLHRERILAIPNSAFWSGDLDRVQKKFDLITFNHVVEHLTDPVGVLRSAANLLAPRGSLVVRVPCFLAVNTDFFVLEHCSHFIMDTLVYALSLAGLRVVKEIVGLSAIEIGVVTEKAESRSLVPDSRAIKGTALRCLAWAESLPPFIEAHAQGKRFGIFGVGGAGLWLGTHFRGRLSFFVDEDPAKQAQSFAGAPIIGVNEIPGDSLVFVTFNSAEASDRIHRRLSLANPRAAFLVPPAVPYFSQAPHGGATLQ
jgi:SAM-dependent methyltransferase